MGDDLGGPTIVTTTKTFTVLANRRALLVSRNVGKNRKNNSENLSDRGQLCGIFSGICYFHHNFCLRNGTELGSDSNYR